MQAAIEEDRNACKKLQQQLGFLGDFISEMAMDLRSTYENGVIDDGILLKELEGSGFQFLRGQIFEGIGSSTRLGTRFRIASVSMSASGQVLKAYSLISTAHLPLEIVSLVASFFRLHRGSTFVELPAAVEKIR